MNKNNEALVTAGKETGVEVNVEKSKYIITSVAHNTGQENMICNNSFEKSEQFSILNCGQSEISLGCNRTSI